MTTIILLVTVYFHGILQEEGLVGAEKSILWAAITINDIGQAVAHLTFQAVSHGLHVHQMAGLDPAEALDAVNAPRNLDAVTVIAIGYLGSIETLPPALQEREKGCEDEEAGQRFAFRNRWPETVA